MEAGKMTQSEAAARARGGQFAGYARATTAAESDGELTRVGPGTPCGEYLRRFWHPVFLSAEVRDLPVPIKVMGEDLVLFRDGEGTVGLVHKNCPHRQASLEFGKCERRGIRCCYHGWHFAADGALLDAPGQPPQVAERLKKRIKLGAYPALEYKGLIFAYLGPPEAAPDFPVYDAMEFPDMEMVPYRAPFACNWLQVLDAILDPLHTSFLHSRMGRTQFSEALAEIGRLDFFERGVWLRGVNTRRVGDNIWMRINELALPNFTQAGSAFAADGTRRRYYGRSSFTRWVVPADDARAYAIAWANFGERGDPPAYNTPEGPELIEQGEVFARDYESRQRRPADAEAVEGMGAITAHTAENLVVSDRGIVLMRKRLREQIRAVAAGGEPAFVAPGGGGVVPTCGGDTILRIPAAGGDESEQLGRLADEFMKAQYAADDLPAGRREEFVIAKLKEMEARGGAQ
jgi:nitrite reductase/ring-hydroxylating ferredoxin subunit